MLLPAPPVVDGLVQLLDGRLEARGEALRREPRRRALGADALDAHVHRLLAIPVAYLIGLTFAALAMVLTATATTIGAMNNFFTLFLMPMFYLSGTFFPLERLPAVAQELAWVLPLTPATSLVRGLMTGELTPWMFAWAAELFGFAVVALFLASFFMRRRLLK